MIIVVSQPQAQVVIKSTFSMLLLLVVVLVPLLALYHEKVDDKLFFFDGNLILYPLVNEVRTLGNGNITDLMVCFFYSHSHDSVIDIDMSH